MYPAHFTLVIGFLWFYAYVYLVTEYFVILYPLLYLIQPIKDIYILDRRFNQLSHGAGYCRFRAERKRENQIESTFYAYLEVEHPGWIEKALTT